LLDVLWAQAALQQDMYRHDLVRAAMVKRDHMSGLRNRKRIKRVVRQLGGSRFRALWLQWHLTHAEVVASLPETESFYRQMNEVENYGDASLKGGRGRRLRFLGSGIFKDLRRGSAA
jgi:hypothetical protein